MTRYEVELISYPDLLVTKGSGYQIRSRAFATLPYGGTACARMYFTAVFLVLRFEGTCLPSAAVVKFGQNLSQREEK